jgi:hypothetical protein
MNWIDDTSYSQGERGKVEPSSWKLTLASGATIWIGKNHRYYPGDWVFKCPAFNQSEPKRMAAKTLEDAKVEAVKLSMLSAKKVRDSAIDFISECEGLVSRV